MSEEILTSAFTGMRGRFLRLARRFLPVAEDADDVLQEAFCRLWPKADSLRDMREAEAMAAVTVRNLCIDTLRRRADRQTVGVDALRHEGDGPAADEAMEREEQLRAVERIIESRLTEGQSRVLRMREMEGLTVAQIAERTGMRPEAVRMQLSRARKTVRECYNKTKEI